MIKESSSKAFDVVLVWKLDRFARDRYDSAYYKRVLRKNGVKVVFMYRAFDIIWMRVSPFSLFIVH